MSDRRSEQREDSVPGGLHHVTIVMVRRVDHELECRVDNRARLFRIEILLELRRSLDIGEIAQLPSYAHPRLTTLRAGFQCGNANPQELELADAAAALPSPPATPSGATAHSPQNFAVGAFSKPHFWRIAVQMVPRIRCKT